MITIIFITLIYLVVFTCKYIELTISKALNQPLSDLLSYTCTVCLEIVDFLLTLVLDIKVHLWHWQPVFDTFVVKLEACYYSLHALLGGKG